MPIEERRSIFDTIAMGTPAVHISDIATVTYSGRSGASFTLANTRPWSLDAEPHDCRSRPGVRSMTAAFSAAVREPRKL
jgi:hypothetical protein